MKLVFPVVVERGGGRYGAYAPEMPGAFVAAPTAAEARRRLRDHLAVSLRLFLDLDEDERPQPDPEVAEALARAMDPNLGHPVDPGVGVVLVEVGPEDAPPDAPSVPPEEAAAAKKGPSRPETFSAVFVRAPDGYSSEVPDLPGCLSDADTREAMQHNIREAMLLHVQDEVDEGKPLPERRRSPDEALAYYCAQEPAADPDDPDTTIWAEPVTVHARPPRPAARLLDAMWRRGMKERDDFERDCAVWRPIAPGESWSGTYAAVTHPLDDVFWGQAPDVDRSLAAGWTRDELRRNLQAAISERLLESIAAGGTIPAPRRTPELALAHSLLRDAEHGGALSEFDATVEMIPVEIEAPRIACAS